MKTIFNSVILYGFKKDLYLLDCIQRYYVNNNLCIPLIWISKDNYTVYSKQYYNLCVYENDVEDIIGSKLIISNTESNIQLGNILENCLWIQIKENIDQFELRVSSEKYRLPEFTSLEENSSEILKSYIISAVLSIIDSIHRVEPYPSIVNGDCRKHKIISAERRVYD